MRLLYSCTHMYYKYIKKFNHWYKNAIACQKSSMYEHIPHMKHEDICKHLEKIYSRKHISILFRIIYRNTKTTKWYTLHTSFLNKYIFIFESLHKTRIFSGMLRRCMYIVYIILKLYMNIIVVVIEKQRDRDSETAPTTCHARSHENTMYRKPPKFILILWQP